MPLPQIMLGLSLLAMFAASFIAIFQNNLKRLFAYSSVGQIGYITLGLSFDSVNGLDRLDRASVQPRHRQGRRSSC